MLNEAENVGPMAEEIAEACTPIGPFEAIFVNDGSTDDTAAEIARMRAEFPWLREVRHTKPCGPRSITQMQSASPHEATLQVTLAYVRQSDSACRAETGSTFRVPLCPHRR